MKNEIPSFLLERTDHVAFVHEKGTVKMSFLEKGMTHLAEVITAAYMQWESASVDGLFQRIDARVKVIFMLAFVVIVSLKKSVLPEIYLGCFTFSLVVLSRLSIISFYRRVLVLGFFFGFLIALPSALNLITKGEIIIPLIRLSQEHQFWVYEIPGEIGVTREGINAVSMLTLRVVNSLSLAFLILHTTPFPEIIKALKVLRVPDSFLMVITLSYKYIFIFARTVEDMHLAKKSRLTQQIRSADAGKWVAGRMGFLFKKTRLRCEDIFKAMLSRGFSDDIRLYAPPMLRARDIGAACVLAVAGVFFLWV
jgi:cobalt ECF transporter T component CbiQ